MNASKTLTAFAAAAALVGGIGYASAQSAGSDTMAPNAGTSTGVTSTDATTSQPAAVDGTTSSPSTMSSDSSTLNAERAPQADRN